MSSLRCIEVMEWSYFYFTILYFYSIYYVAIVMFEDNEILLFVNEVQEECIQQNPWD